MPHPPLQIETSDDVANVLQITDMHLSLDVTRSVAGINCQKGFEQCLAQALSEKTRCDFILVTGDLVNEVKEQIYDRIFATLEQTGIPFACIAGNHDVTDELGEHLPFHQRTFIAHQPDNRLLSNHRLIVGTWQLLLLDSSIPGQVAGEMSLEDIAWLDSILQRHSEPALIALHHHVVPMSSRWIDIHLIANVEKFWQVIRQHSHAKVITTGHVHQAYAGLHHGVAVYATPSTCYQFKPKQDQFGLDVCANPGYRWLALRTDGSIDSWVKRLQNKQLVLDH